MAKKRAKRHWYSRRGRRRSTRDKRFPLAYAPAIIVPAASILMGGGSGYGGVHGGLIDAFKSGDTNHIVAEIKNVVPYELIGYGYDGTWHFDIISRNLGLILGGMVVDKLATATGLNKQMRKIPVIGRFLKV